VPKGGRKKTTGQNKARKDVNTRGVPFKGVRCRAKVVGSSGGANGIDREGRGAYREKEGGAQKKPVVVRKPGKSSQKKRVRT